VFFKSERRRFPGGVVSRAVCFRQKATEVSTTIAGLHAWQTNDRMVQPALPYWELEYHSGVG